MGVPASASPEQSDDANHDTLHSSHVPVRPAGLPTRHRGPGSSLGAVLGEALGARDGATLGTAVGLADGNALGAALGTTLGDAVGLADGAALGLADGAAVGADGLALGAPLGLAVGASVLSQHAMNSPVAGFGQHGPLRPSAAHRGCEAHESAAVGIGVGAHFVAHTRSTETPTAGTPGIKLARAASKSAATDPVTAVAAMPWATTLALKETATAAVGATDGTVGACDGDADGSVVGDRVEHIPFRYCDVGLRDGRADGDAEGAELGDTLGPAVGAVGLAVGARHATAPVASLPVPSAHAIGAATPGNGQ